MEKIENGNENSTCQINSNNYATSHFISALMAMDGWKT